MSTKKSKTKKAAPKKAAKAVKGKPKAKATKPAKRTTSPRSQALPGMEGVRYKALDQHCERISDIRGDLNRIRGEEADMLRHALVDMQKNKLTAYRFAGVELVLVPGDVKLRVRTVKEKATSDGDAGSGQDAGEILDGLTASELDETAASDLEG